MGISFSGELSNEIAKTSEILTKNNHIEKYKIELEKLEKLEKLKNIKPYKQKYDSDNSMFMMLVSN
jgi:hypothetical protein